MGQIVVISVFSKVPVGGREQDEQLALRFPKALNLQSRPGAAPVHVEAPAVLRNESTKKYVLVLPDGTQVGAARAQSWLTHNRALEDAFQHRTLVQILIVEGEDLAPIVQSLEANESVSIAVQGGEPQSLDAFVRAGIEAWNGDVDTLNWRVLWLREGLEQPIVVDGTFCFPAGKGDDRSRQASWQPLVYIQLSEEFATSLLWQVQGWMGRLMDELKSMAGTPGRIGTAQESSPAGDAWDGLIRVGQLRHAWALMITQRQAFLDAAQEGSLAFTNARYLGQELGLGHKLEAVANVLAAAEQLVITTTVRHPGEQRGTFEPSDALTATLVTLAEEGKAFNEIVKRLDDIGERFKEAMSLNKMYIAALLGLGLLVVGTAVLQWMRG